MLIGVMALVIVGLLCALARVLALYFAAVEALKALYDEGDDDPC